MNTLALMRSFNAVVGRAWPAVPARLARNLLLRPRRRRAIVELPGAQRVTLRAGTSALRWGTAGPTVLMLHGWEGTVGQFAPLVAPLLAAGRQVVALDPPAHGVSPGREATLMSFAAALQDAAREVGDVEAVVGHSLGAAAVAVALWRGLPVQRAVLVAAPASIEAHLRRFARQLALPPEATERFLRLVEQANGIAPRDVDVARIAARLQLPALVVHDRDDRAVPFADGSRIARAWEAARWLATTGLGHNRILADAGVVRAIAGFLVPRASAAAPRLESAPAPAQALA